MARKRSAPRPVRAARRIPAPQKRIDVTRGEFNRLITLLNERSEILNSLRHNQEIQFKRIAQIQGELDMMKRAWEKLHLT